MITKNRLTELLDTALYGGGSDRWAMAPLRRALAKRLGVDESNEVGTAELMAVVIMGGGGIWIKDQETGKLFDFDNHLDAPAGELSMKEIEAAWDKLSPEEKEFISSEDEVSTMDADDADYYLQMFLFGEIVFG